MYDDVLSVRAVFPNAQYIISRFHITPHQISSCGYDVLGVWIICNTALLKSFMLLSGSSQPDCSLPETNIKDFKNLLLADDTGSGAGCILVSRKILKYHLIFMAINNRRMG